MTPPLWNFSENSSVLEGVGIPNLQHIYNIYHLVRVDKMASLGAGKEILWDCTSIFALLHCFILSCSAVSDAVAKFVVLYAASVKV